MDLDEFVAVAVDESTAREHAEARFTAQLEKGHYGNDAERRIQWVTGRQGPELHRYGASFGRTGWHASGFGLIESPLIGSGPMVMMSTMCSCGDMQPIADPGTGNLFVSHVNAKTGEPCRGLPLAGHGEEASVVLPPCEVCGKADWPAGGMHAARSIHMRTHERAGFVPHGG